MRSWLIFVAALILCGPAALHAQPAGNDPAVLRMRAADAVAVMQQLRSASDVFNSAFLAEVPATRLASTVAQLEGQHGKLLGAENLVQTGPSMASLTLVFERARAAATMVLEPNPPRRISGLRITNVTGQSAIAPITPLTVPVAPQTSPSGTGWPAPLTSNPGQSLATDFAALPGVAGFSVARLGLFGPQVIQSHRGDQPLAIGSAFKLWVLDAVAQDVAEGRLSWSQMVPIGPRSLPSGITQDWAQGTPASLEQLATLMISISDNTATDTLIRLVGRERVEARLGATGHSRPDLLRPFLMTSEAFNLKLGPQATRDAYAQANGFGRAQILGQLPQGVDPAVTGNVAAFAAGPPVSIDSVEWFASTNDLVRVLDALRRRSDPKVQAILATSPGMPQQLRSSFAYAGYKGGSEPGVLNLSWLLRRPSGTWYFVTASWVNKTSPLDNSRMEALVPKLFALAP
jgi:beta-lactamase class A